MTEFYFPPVSGWRMPRSVFDSSLEEMARDGVQGNEGIMLWLGHRDESLVDITHLVALRGPGIIKEPDFLSIEPELLNEVTDLGIQIGAHLVGQIHSHFSAEFLDLSYTDRTYGIRAPDYLSLVAPDYGMNPVTSINDCGVHVFELGRGYRRLAPDEVARRIQVVDGPSLPVLTVGEE
jgi:hypothetical protein